MGECLKHPFDLVKVRLNYESNVDIVVERIVFEGLFSKIINYKTISGFWNLITYLVKRQG